LACSHGGFVDAGREHFDMISQKYGVDLIL
jgi:hypothetical protein